VRLTGTHDEGFSGNTLVAHNKRKTNKQKEKHA
jgi:hypothetical protein